MKIVPASAFSGRPASNAAPSGSRHVPVHAGSGSIFVPAWVSLYETSVRPAVDVPSMLGSQRVFQKIWLPLKKARFTPASARRLDVRALVCRPVLVVSNRHEHVVLLEPADGPGVDVAAADVGHVVPVLLQPPHHRELGVEERVLRRVAPSRERPVVAHFVGAARVRARSTRVQAVAAVGVVRLPRGVRRLEQQVGVAGVVPNHERYVARTTGVGAGKPRDVHPRNCVRRHGPRRRFRPVSAIDETCGAVGEAWRLGLRQSRTRVQRRDVPCARASVVPHPVDVDGVRRRIGSNLENSRLADVDAEGRREPLYRGVTRAAHVPFGRGSPGQTVLGDNSVRGRRAWIGSRCPAGQRR